MQKFTSFPNPCNIPFSPIKSLFLFFSSLPETPNLNPVFLNYLIESLNFPESRAVALSNQCSHIKSLEKPQNVCQFFRNIGFSEIHIQSTVRASPRLLLCDIDKTLKPKIEFFQSLGVAGSDLGKLISKHSLLLTVSLEKRLIPFIEILKQVLVNDKNNENLVRTLTRCNRILATPKSLLLSNIASCKSYGIVGSQLSTLLTMQPRLFVMPDFKVEKLVSQLLDMGFSVNSNMFVHGLRTLSSLSEENFLRKLELFRSFGFSKDEFIRMFRKAPVMPTMSEEKLKSGLEFFFKKAELEKAAVMNQPVCLMYSLENRVIPRYRVIKILISRSLLKKHTFPRVLDLTEEKFLQRFVLRFRDDAEELLLAYKGQKSGSSSSTSDEES